jgi:hypothetical protein
MGSRFPLMRKTVATTVVGAALIFGTAGAAGASAPRLTVESGSPGATSQPAPATRDRLDHFSCTRASRSLTRIQKAEAGIAAGLPKLHVAEAQATAAGQTRKATRIGKLITRLERPGATARLQRMAAAIEVKCKVAAQP